METQKVSVFWTLTSGSILPATACLWLLSHHLCKGLFKLSTVLACVQTTWFYYTGVVNHLKKRSYLQLHCPKSNSSSDDETVRITVLLCGPIYQFNTSILNTAQGETSGDNKEAIGSFSTHRCCNTRENNTVRRFSQVNAVCRPGVTDHSRLWGNTSQQHGRYRLVFIFHVASFRRVSCLTVNWVSKTILLQTRSRPTDVKHDIRIQKKPPYGGAPETCLKAFHIGLWIYT